ncbi:threonine/homoserine/homoserine lactone efflux protein [Murinocardiopsis flavida]|uniref:Threonine/homoserine/homoserine lactone efflux protein n=1 Tax=Murinocardiopsis flavida TaxID=645275 RepID=A0A2P8DE46_9ACTN|nr:LysE family translocator [Murinocardiopsis flavida]PSK95503.1 threonine/homoserine/homoserine lactone efflux protein [Murinocardiopsis flavida]
MPTATTLLAFSLASFALIIIPGPSVLFVLGRALSQGRGTALRSAFGNALGALVLVAAVAIGVGAVIVQYAVLFTTLKMLGAAYLIYLGIRAIRSRRAFAASLDAPPEGRGGARAVWDGFVVGATNPKTLVFFLAVLPQFTDTGLGNMPGQILVLGTVFVAIGVASDSVYALAAGAARQWFLRGRRRLEVTGAVSGVLMIGLGAHLALTGRRA